MSIVAEAKKVLNMDSWIVFNNFSDGMVEPTQAEDGRYFITSARNTVTKEYEKITIDWKPAILDEIRTMPIEAVRETVYHEVIHGLTQEMYDISLDRFTTTESCREAIERLTQRFTRIICMQMLTNQK